jgi:sulfite exporter TauE/SafE
MSDQYLAFMIGILGSVHCVGMCGPLAFAVPSLRGGTAYLVLDKVMYQVGRIIAYCTLGAIIGLIGAQLWMAGLQQTLSLITGCLILLSAFSRLLKRSSTYKFNYLLKPFNYLFGYALKHKANHLIIGIINGFLPCGFVYLAMAAAVNTQSVSSAVTYMFWFGVGTTPLMLISALTVGFMGKLVRVRINTYVPYLMMALGVWFILRGMDLNIPYLSPSNPARGTVNCK